MGYNPLAHDHHDGSDPFWTTASATEIGRDDIRYFLVNPERLFRLRPVAGGPAALVLAARPPGLSYPGVVLKVFACAMEPGPGSDEELLRMNGELERLAG